MLFLPKLVCGLIWKRLFSDICKDLNMKLSWITQDSKSNDKYLLTEEEYIQVRRLCKEKKQELE